MPSERSEGEVEQETVQLDTTVIDSADVSDIGLYELADEIVAVGGEPNQAGTLDRRVRVRGEIIIEAADRDDDE